jgi:lambda family phage minor tail protein L
MPIQAEGFSFNKGQLPRPTLTVSNALGTITAILLNVNSITTGNDLTGATVTRIRTLARYLDGANFAGNTNPLGTPDPTAEFPQEIYKIDRKSAENREVVSFELAAVFDLAGVRAPKRQCTRTEFPSIGTFIA